MSAILGLGQPRTEPDLYFLNYSCMRDTTQILGDIQKHRAPFLNEHCMGCMAACVLRGNGMVAMFHKHGKHVS